MRRFLFFYLSLPLALWANTSDITADLRNPKYKNGILYTHEGGVIRGKDLRIQAKSLQYVKRTEEGKQVHRLEAEGDLMILYKGHIYVGSELTYDFDTNSGTVYDGKTFSSLWYVGGDLIQLNPDGSYRVTNASFTTCENIDPSWDFHAGRVNVVKDELLEAKKVRFRLFKSLGLWLPSFRLNLKKFKAPVFRYSVNWDKGQGPRAMIRYQFYSWRGLALYGRLEYRWRTGWGGAFETEYFPTHRQTTFVTRSYLGTDRLENAPNKQRRYRLQGALHSTSNSGSTHTTLTWDKYSDVRMPNDFKSEDFEVNTAKRTLFYVHHQEPNVIMSLKARPRVNPFESIKQDLPSLFLSTRPMSLGNSGVMVDFWSKAAYLNFTYSDQLAQYLPGFRSVRLEARPVLYRPFHLGPLILTPRIGAVGIFYSNSPTHKAKSLGTLLYGGSLFASASREFESYRHIIKPYANYYGLSSPTVQPNDHFIFSIQDGYHQINQLQIGVRNALYFQPYKKRSLSVDLYANAFFSNSVIPQLLPKVYLNIDWQLPSLLLSCYNAWNFQKEVLDFSNSRLQWTVSEDLAFSLGLRYRSSYDWRKADHENFILDVTKSDSELLLSPISDQRLTVLTHAFIRLTPFWECHLQSHQGFLRKGQDPYNEFKIDLFTWISSSWKLRLSYSHTQKDDRVTAGMSLIKK